MISSLKPYPRMKGSGVPWLGDIPEHWEVRRVRNVVDMRVSNVDKLEKETEHPVRLCNYVDVYKNDRIHESISFMNATATKEEIDRFCLAPGDVLITKDSETWNDIGIPAYVEHSAPDIICGYHLAILRPFQEQLYGAFLFWVVQSSHVALQFNIAANGVTRFGLSHGAIASICLPLPSLSEQAAIVKFIDHYDRRIRRYIRAKQKLIKLLEEQKQAIIHRAVTGQVDVRTGNPYPTYKPSGVEWLGDIPEHWEIRGLKWVAQLNPSKKEASTFLSSDTSVTFLPMERVGTNGKSDFGKPMEAEKFWQGFTYFRKGDVIVAKITPCFENGKGACLESMPTDVGFGSTEFHVLRAKGSISPQYLYRFTTLEKFRRLGADAMTGAAGQQRVPQSFIANFKIVLPSLPEQTLIVEYLDKETIDTELTINNTRRGIELLREYRTRLIADVVTGKLDVREAAARLPDEIEEPEPLEAADELIDADDPTGNEELAEALPEEVEA